MDIGELVFSRMLGIMMGILALLYLIIIPLPHTKGSRHPDSPRMFVNRHSGAAPDENQHSSHVWARRCFNGGDPEAATSQR